MKPLNTQKTLKAAEVESLPCVLCIPWLKNGFSLIELMIVIVILGALTAIIVPMFTYSESEAKTDAVTSEMSRIQRAYLDFYNDNFPHTAELENLSCYGLYPLCFTNEPDGYYSTHGGTWSAAVRGEYDPYNQLGWKGPYLMHEGLLEVDVTEEGQEAKTEGTKIPVVKDPYGGYYRVIASAADSNKLSLVCTGVNQKLQTTSADTNDYGWIMSMTNGVDDAGWRKDDIALPLLPFN